mgnify:CR=1 FL=1
MHVHAGSSSRRRFVANPPPTRPCILDASTPSLCPQVPAEAASQPVPTRAQLSEEFENVARLSRQLGMLPEGQGGLLSLALAKLAAALKVGCCTAVRNNSYD